MFRLLVELIIAIVLIIFVVQMIQGILRLMSGNSNRKSFDRPGRPGPPPLPFSHGAKLCTNHQCGRPNRDQAKYCSTCGHTIGAADRHDRRV